MLTPTSHCLLPVFRMALAQKLHFSQAILTALQGDLAGRIAVPFLPALLKGQGSGPTEPIQKEQKQYSKIARYLIGSSIVSD